MHRTRAPPFPGPTEELVAAALVAVVEAVCADPAGRGLQRRGPGPVATAGGRFRRRGWWLCERGSGSLDTKWVGCDGLDVAAHTVNQQSKPANDL